MGIDLERQQVKRIFRASICITILQKMESIKKSSAVKDKPGPHSSVGGAAILQYAKHSK